MLRQRLNKIETRAEEIRQANRREVVITHYLNRTGRPDYYEYKSKTYNTLEELKADNGITEKDNLFTIVIAIMHTKEDIEKFKNYK